ncbi:MAG: hypothetical protein ACP6IS_02510 [Candidatus Asgardarchaeia archaeon]
MALEPNSKMFIYETIGLLALMLIVFPVILGAGNVIDVYVFLLFSIPRGTTSWLIFILLVVLSLVEIFLAYIVSTGKGLKNLSPKIKAILINNAVLAPLLYGFLAEILTLTSILRIGQLILFLILAFVGFIISKTQIE